LSLPFGVVVDTVNNEVVVANPGNNTNSITVYTRTASGNTAPLRTLTGAFTGLSGPGGVVVDPVNNELVVGNFTTPSITVYTRTADGNVAPLRTLSGGTTGLSGPFGVVVDTVNSELVVANNANNSITVYTRTASGNTAPLRTLSGALTGLGPRFIDVTTTATVEARLTNLSTRGLVQTGDNVLIGGFIIEGDTSKRVLVRAIGPTLGPPPFNVMGALPNPEVTLVAGQTPIARNNDWQDQSDPTCANAGLICGAPTDIAATLLAPPNPLEAAILITLLPGPYTAIVSGFEGATGVGLVEVFEVP
jgi:hypothetical protein